MTMKLKNRKNYTVSLDRDDVERLKLMLKDRHMTFSGFLAGQIKTFLYVMSTENGAPLDPGKMTLDDFGALLAKMMRIMKEG